MVHVSPCEAGEGMDINVADALRYANEAAISVNGQALRAPETAILKGTWRGLTYEQIAKESEYSKNYLMRDIAPKLWKQLSSAFGRSISKTNFRVVLETYANDHIFKSGFAPRSFALQGASQEISASPLKPALSKSFLSKSFLSKSTVRPLSLQGYEAELAQIKQWLSIPTSKSQQFTVATADRLSGYCLNAASLIGIWGLNGVGKSLLCEAVAAELGSYFDVIVWRSLKRKPLLHALCTSILTTLDDAGLNAVRLNMSEQSGSPSPDSSHEQISLNHSVESQPVEQLLSAMAQHRILLIIEDAEFILKPKALAGDYCPEHQPYREFVQFAAGCQSSIIVTGTEAPADWLNPADQHKQQHSLYLTGLDDISATALLTDESLRAPEYWPELIRCYQGHPLALQSAARVIREMFNGKVDAFLQQDSVLFADIIRLLTPSFERLCELELTILYWLASQKDPLSLEDIQQTLPSSLSSTELISALDSLKQRSYLHIQTETTPPTFYLPPLIKAFSVHRLMAQFKGNDALSEITATSPLSYSSTDPVITLSAPAVQSVHLNKWLQGCFEAEWNPLSQLFQSGKLPSTRLRSAYHLRDATFVKRYKSIDFGVLHENAHQNAHQNAHPGQEDFKQGRPEKMPSAKGKPARGNTAATGVILVVAVRRKAETLYEIYVQVQPGRGADALPTAFELRLFDAKKTLLSIVQAQQTDCFIQLPYFQGQLAESFEIELATGKRSHTESFLI